MVPEFGPTLILLHAYTLKLKHYVTIVVTSRNYSILLCQWPHGRLTVSHAGVEFFRHFSRKSCSRWLFATSQVGSHRMSLANVSSREEKVFSRREVEGLIAEGRKIVIVGQKVLKVDAWLRYHPGGDKAILHMVGRDATDEVYG